MKLSFDNTQKAFAHKSTADLIKARRLFQLFAYPFIVDKGPILANVALRIGLPIKGIIKKTIFHQFCGGEDIESSLESAKELYLNGVGAILDYSVEGEGSESSYDRTFKELLAVINYTAEHEEFPFAVFKCTGLGPLEVMRKLTEGEVLSESEQLKFNAFEERVDGLCKAAYQNNIQIFIDAEESWIQDCIDLLSYQMMEKYNSERAVVYNTIQLYRKDRVDEIRKQIVIAKSKGYHVGFKLVRGAYMEKEGERALELGYPNPIQDSKSDTDLDYNRAVELCFEHRNIVSICAGTHNEGSSELLANLIHEAEIDKNDGRFWFAQLYGMSDHISFNLVSEGFNVAKYLPYGPVKEVLPYLARRAQENSAVKGQTGRELELIKRELERRLNH
ncbi:MAG: proline dehydrogenase family protein [Bacteroidia bacterium]